MGNAKERTPYWDVANGIMVMWMILYHTFQSSSGVWNIVTEALFNLFYFFMPWFFFKAGVFWKEKPIKDVIKAGWLRLGRPWLMFVILGHLLWCLQIWFDGDTNWMHYALSPFKAILKFGTVAGAMPLWFLFSLFCIRVIYTYLRKGSVPAWVVAVTSLTIWYMLECSEIRYPIYLFNISCGLFFYATGNFWQRKTSFQKKYVIWNALVIYVVTLTPPKFLGINV